MDFTKTVTPEEQEYIHKIFHKFQKELEAKIEKEVHDEMLLLSKYKGDLARSYHEVLGYKSALIGCMKEILDKQDDLIGLCGQLGDMAARIERMFLKDKKTYAK